jgi:hypothetical protein
MFNATLYICICGVFSFYSQRAKNVRLYKIPSKLMVRATSYPGSFHYAPRWRKDKAGHVSPRLWEITKLHGYAEDSQRHNHSS